MNVEMIFRNNRWLAYIPVLGISFYVILYFIAAQKYAGGFENYSIGDHLLCDLMNTYSTDGYLNDGRLPAIIGNSSLFVGMVTFFYLIPLQFDKITRNIKWAQLLGVIAMFNFLFLFSQYHDVLVLASGCLSMVMVTLLIFEYYRQTRNPVKTYSIVCLVLSISVFLSYQLEIGLDFLPIFQKTVFLLDGIWVFVSCMSLMKYSSQSRL